MGKFIKQSIICLVLLSLIIPVFAADPTSEELEAKLADAKGKERLQVLVNLSEALYSQDPNKSITYGQEALELLNSFPDEQYRAIILNSLSQAHLRKSDYKAAEKYGNDCYLAAEKARYKIGMAKASQSIARAAERLGKYNNSLQHYQEALKIYKELADQEGKGEILNAISLIYWQLNNYPKALDYLFMALKVFEKLNNQSWIANLNNNIGIMYWESRNYEKSLEHYLISLELSRKLNDKRAIASRLNNIGLVYYAQDNYEKALEYHDTTLTLALELGEKLFLSTVYANVGASHTKLKNYKRALGYFKKAFLIRKNLKDKRLIARVLIKMAPAKRGLGLYEEVIDDVTKAINIGESIQTPSEISDGSLQLSLTYEAMGDHQKALEYYKKFKEAQDEIFNEKNAKIIANLEANFEIERQEKEIQLLKKDKQIQLFALIFVIIIAVLVIILAFSIYARYRLKVKSERELRESEEKFRVLAEQAVVGIRIVLDNTIQYANPIHLLNFGFTWDEMIGKNPVDLAVQEDQPLVKLHLEKRLSGADDAQAYEFKGRNKAGRLISLESYGALTLYQGKPAVLETVIDVTERKKVEMELLKHRKLKSVGILAGGIAHDFNNLLTVIIGNIGMAKMSINETAAPKSHELLERAESASYQATDLAQKFITFSEGGWFAPKKVVLHELLMSTIDLYPDLSQCDYNIAFPEDLNRVYGDERQIKEVLLNLLLNAHDAIPHDDKQISVVGENFDIYTGNEFLLDPGKYVKVSVIDNGTGIPDDQLEKIFDPYWSTKNEVSKKGLGLGLAICYSIMKRHKGHIKVTSEVGKGSTFEVYFPTFRAPDKQEDVVI